MTGEKNSDESKATPVTEQNGYGKRDSYFKGKYYYSGGKRYARYYDGMPPDEVAEKCELIDPMKAYEHYMGIKKHW